MPWVTTAAFPDVELFPKENEVSWEKNEPLVHPQFATSYRPLRKATKNRLMADTPFEDVAEP